MGVQQPRARSDVEPAMYRDSDDGGLLEGAELFDRLESGAALFGDGAQSGDPVTGIAYGVVFGGLFWAIVAIAAYFIAV
jgi:hypothetical protein